MVLEVADIVVAAKDHTDFERAIHLGVESVISKARGFKTWRLVKGHESTDRYLLLIEWETLENHTVDFRGSSAYADWRSIVGPFFSNPPRVEHFSTVVGQWRKSVGGRAWRAPGSRVG